MQNYSAISSGVLKILNSVPNEKDVDSDNTREINSVSDILNKYESFFHGIGKMKDIKMKVVTDESVTPVTQKHHRVPFHLRDKVHNELKRSFDARTVESVNDTSEWVSPVVAVPKRNSDRNRLR